MAQLVLKSEEQILADMARLVLQRTGLNDLNPGSIILTLLQTAAKENYSQYYQMLQIIRNYSLDNTSGSDLDNRAAEYGLERKQALRATGKIRILREESFEKISTTYYTGFRSRIAGDTILYVNDASAIVALANGTYTLILGRGTSNEEEVQFVKNGSNPQNFVNYYQISLTTPLTADHALDETVILKQGIDINLAAGMVVQVPATGNTPAVIFTTTTQATLLAGEAYVDDVDVQASQTGIVGNIGVLAINGTEAFTSAPFTGARAQNLAAFSNGQDRESDQLLRSRIKSAIQGLSQSTQSGISNAINGLVDPDTAKRVVSSNIIIPDNVGLPVKIYIDDGTGFEPSFENQGQETILADATGGELRLQLALFPLVKAQVTSQNSAPYDMSSTLTLTVEVGNLAETITFFTSDFVIPSAGTAEEIVTVINNRSNLLEARTAEIGTKVVINGRSDINEAIKVTGGTANVASKLDFPTEKVYTFYLYANDELLSKDGETATIVSTDGPYDFSGADKYLSVTVDGKTANVQTVTISEGDFVSPAAAAQATAAQVAAIINTQLAGATATDNNGALRITSNTQLSAASKIKINTSTANTEFGFSTTEIVGRDQDYTLNPDLGIIELNDTLAENDLITSGTRNTAAFLTATKPENYTFVGGETLLVEIDGDTAQTVTFTAAAAQTASQVATFVNTQLIGATARVRTRGADQFLEIATNTLSGNGSLKILSSSTAANIFDFPMDTLKDNLTAHTAFKVAGDAGPFAFVEGETLVVIIDDSALGKSYIITMSYSAGVTSGSSTTVFAASLLSSVFTANDVLNSFYVVFKSGANTVEGDIGSVTNPSGNTFRYIFTEPPANFTRIATNDHASFADMADPLNDGNFLITNHATQNVVHADVLSRAYDNPSALTPASGDRYLIAPAANTTTAASVIKADLDTPTGLTPSVNDRYIVAPGANDTALAPVLNLYTDSASATTVHGNRYLINGVGLNDWAGHNNVIAQYNGVGSPGWLFITPVDGDVVLDQNSGNYYQFDGGGGTWVQNNWGSKAGKVATWNGSAWTFTTPADNEVRNVTFISELYQYDLATNTWSANVWGGSANKIAQWNGSAWVYTTPATNDVVTVTDETITLIYSGSTWSEFFYWVEVTNANGVTQASAAGTALLGERRQVTDYNATTGALTVTPALAVTPSLGDDFLLLPSTSQNVVDYFSNSKVTSLGATAEISLAEQGALVQIASKSNGSDGFVQIAGGSANTQLDFQTTINQGIPGYAYYTGLIKLVHRTIYGDESDLVSYPGVGAAGIKFRPLPPTVQNVSFALQVVLSNGVSLSNVENEIKTQVINYVNNLGVSGDVILSNVVATVLSLGTVLDCKILSPSDNIAIAENELAKTKASLISVETI